MNDAERLIQRIKNKVDEAEKQGEQVTVIGVHLTSVEHHCPEDNLCGLCKSLIELSATLTAVDEEDHG